MGTWTVLRAFRSIRHCGRGQARTGVSAAGLRGSWLRRLEGGGAHGACGRVWWRFFCRALSAPKGWACLHDGVLVHCVGMVEVVLVHALRLFGREAAIERVLRDEHHPPLLQLLHDAIAHRGLPCSGAAAAAGRRPWRQEARGCACWRQAHAPLAVPPATPMMNGSRWWFIGLPGCPPPARWVRRCPASSGSGGVSHAKAQCC